MTQTSVFDHPKPDLPLALILQQLQADYGLSGALKPLVSERDQNFRVETGGGAWVLKIANAAEDVRFLKLQNACLTHLAEIDPALGVQRLIPARNGQDLVYWTHAGQTHAVRLLSFLSGDLYSAAPKSHPLLASLGRLMGRLSCALQGFSDASAHRPDFLWNLDRFPQIKSWLPDVAGSERDLVGRVFNRYDTRVVPRLKHLRLAVLHQDANDNNLIVSTTEPPAVTGLIDFGDMCQGRQINELAVTLAYALLDSADVLADAGVLIRAYTAEFPLQAAEASVLFDLVAARLAMSVCISSHRAKDFPDNPYLLISQRSAFALLAKLDQTDPEFLSAFARHAAGLDAVGSHCTILQWLQSAACHPVPVLGFDLHRSQSLLVSLAPTAEGGDLLHDPAAHSVWLANRLSAVQAQFGVGLYGEQRGGGVYAGEQFANAASPERRTQHLGIDLFAPAGTPVHAPLPGRVASLANHQLPNDYGPTLILEHQAGPNGPTFWTLYGHLAASVLERLQVGMAIAAGDVIAHLGDHTINGGWAPHLHFQIITDRLSYTNDFPGAGQPSLWPLWQQLSPDPNLILRLAPERFAVDPNPPALLLQRRAQVLSPSLSISYAHKLKIVRGQGAYLYDHTGRAYIDGVNNICHVGHSHPHVVAALAKQAAQLNTNTRYLHETILDYTERLTRTFPEPLRVAFLVCSGSEANELALRIARTVTGRQHTITLDWAYHGNTNAAIDVSPYKFNRKGGRGKPAHVQIATLPDPYRGSFKGTSAATGVAYAQSVAEQIAVIRATTGQGPAAFIAEAISGCGGQVFFPDAYLSTSAALVRKAGGLVIVDEVQTGFGRIGEQFWAHGPQGVIPDIVTLGKPIGNGHPMAAVITTAEIARAFANGMEFFSSFGGNPVSCAVGMAVLDVIEQEGLQHHALTTGEYLKRGLLALADRHALIGDVRGQGLFVGVELVQDRETLTPATEAATRVVNHMREHGVLLSTDGPFDNVLKIKPPLAFGRLEADVMIDALDRALTAPH
ncbi:aminotransferase class III-fold pyridoxal phosphate-dependent enzyme [Ahniella affigens]|nr:aminotransferase class III-fold pyridoxal phosphate-dependent enzyme [Ahniella affigens]